MPAPGATVPSGSSSATASAGAASSGQPAASAGSSAAMLAGRGRSTIGSIQTSNGSAAATPGGELRPIEEAASAPRPRVRLQVALPMPQVLQLQSAAPQQCRLSASVATPAIAAPTALAVPAAAASVSPGNSTALGPIAAAAAPVASVEGSSGRNCAVSALVQYAAARAEQLTSSHGVSCKCRCRTPPAAGAAERSLPAAASNDVLGDNSDTGEEATGHLAGAKRAAEVGTEVAEESGDLPDDLSGSRKRMRSETPCTPALASRLVQHEGELRTTMHSRRVERQGLQLH
jgi:hypothetical protein